MRYLLAFSLIATACATRTVPQTPPPAEHVHEHGTMLPAFAGPGYTVADVQFMQHMIGHHAQAIQMTDLASQNGASSKIRELAQKIDISQRDEIGMMKEWLAERKQAVPDETTSHMMMPGMLSAGELARLAAARGSEFDRLFLTFMIRHHQGALQMSEELFKHPGAGQDPDIFRFVTDVDADQRDEIFVMERLLDTIGQDSK